MAVNLLLELKFLDTRFPRIAEAHMKTIRAALSKKGIDAGVSDIGLVSQRRRAFPDFWTAPGGLDPRKEGESLAKQRWSFSTVVVERFPL